MRTVTNTQSWDMILENIMLDDVCAPASILSYYFDNLDGYSTGFCPLGYDLYKVIGHAMRENSEAFEAAVNTGLFYSAITTHVSCALDLWDNWVNMNPGIIRLIEDPRLRIFINYRNRIYIDRLRNITDENAWYEAVAQLDAMMEPINPKGY